MVDPEILNLVTARWISIPRAEQFPWKVCRGGKLSDSRGYASFNGYPLFDTLVFRRCTNTNPFVRANRDNCDPRNIQLLRSILRGMFIVKNPDLYR